MAQFSGQEPELLSMFKPWLIQAIQSGILGGMNHVSRSAVYVACAYVAV